MDAEFWYCDEELLVSQSILRDRDLSVYGSFSLQPWWLSSA